MTVARMQWLFLFVILVVLQACGFQLRGEAALPAGATVLAVDAVDPDSPLKRDLEAALKRAGADVRASTGAGVATLKLPVMRLGTEPVTIGKNARVKEYRVYFRVELEVLAADGRVMLARTPLELTRDYTFDEQQALGAEVEQEVIRKELQRDMVQQVLRRVERAR